MERTTISIPDELLRRLRIIAAERRTSIAALVREALEERVTTYRPRHVAWEAARPAGAILHGERVRNGRSRVCGADPRYGSAVRFAGPE